MKKLSWTVTFVAARPASPPVATIIAGCRVVQAEHIVLKVMRIGLPPLFVSAKVVPTSCR